MTVLKGREKFKQRDWSARPIYWMNVSGFVNKPLVIGMGAILTGGAEKPAEIKAAQAPPNGFASRSDVTEVASQTGEPGDWGGVTASLSPLQEMIQEILAPLALQTRPVREWRSLYRSFFGFFAHDGGADETERKAWAMAAEVFNTDLVAVCNRTTRVVPMTFQDFVDGVDSFRHDGMREGGQRDIAWQPKKILLLTAAMIGRIIAGWQADAKLPGEPHQGLFPFRHHLIAENRKATFLGSIFGYDSRFSILEYPAAGLKPVLHSLPHFAHALMENGIYRCELRLSPIPANPPLLRAHFRRPLRTSIPMGTISALDVVLLAGRLPVTVGSSTSPSAYFEFSRTALDALTFESSDAPEIKISKIEKLFELAATDGLLVCAPHRADVSAAARIGKALGRTPAETFVIERFFALGFRNGHGNEPWLEQAVSEASPRDPNNVKKARKQFAHWKSACLFFVKTGQPQAADIPGARIRQEALQPRDSDTFLSLLRTSVYEPLMAVFVAVDAQGAWLLDEPAVHAFARKLSGGLGDILSESAGVVAQCAESLSNQETKVVFLFECAVGILVGATCGHKSEKRSANLYRATGALRKHYEGQFSVSLSGAPSVLKPDPAKGRAQAVATKKTLEEAERTILDLVGQPLSRVVCEPLRGTLAGMLESHRVLFELPMPSIRLDDRAAFEASITGLCAWARSQTDKIADAYAQGASGLLSALVEVRVLAEEGKLAEALEKASGFYPGLSGTQRQILAPFSAELSWLFLREIERELDRGDTAKAAVLAEKATALVEGTSSQADLKNLLQDLLATKPAEKAIAPPEQAPGGPASEARTSRTRQAETLLRDYAEELSLPENQLEQDFLNSVLDGSDAGFKRKEKLRNRLQRRTRWGGREPFKTSLKLLESITTASR